VRKYAPIFDRVEPPVGIAAKIIFAAMRNLQSLAS
jgi:hypothetical protein